MNKQKKVLNKINYNSGLDVAIQKAARKRKNDEFYTPLKDITEELSHWRDKFTGKKIVCPCDWDIIDSDPSVVGIHIEMDNNLSDRDKKWGITRIKKCYLLRYTRTGCEGIIDTPLIKQDLRPDPELEEITPTELMHRFFKDVVPEDRFKDLILEEVDPETAWQVTCGFIKFFMTTDCESITASGYDIDSDRGIKFQEVRYENYDICVTNPPFSLFSEFMDIMVSVKKQHPEFNFIFLAPFLNRGNPNVGLRIMLKQCYLGYGRKLRVYFIKPSEENKFTGKWVAVDWITSYPDAQAQVDETSLHNTIYYFSNDSGNPVYGDEYKEMLGMTMRDGTHPIRINNFRAIPDDYPGWMFCSVGVLDVLSNNEFEWYITQCHKFLNDMYRSGNSPFRHPVSNEMYKDSSGNSGFAGVICRRRTPENGNMNDPFSAEAAYKD